MRFAVVFLTTFVMASADKIKLEKNTEMSHKLVKRNCQTTCETSSSCNCPPIYIVLQISCNCPQICKCVPTAPTYPPGPYTLPPTLPTLTPVTYPLSPITPTSTASFQPSYCCILFICGSCGYYGSTYGGLQPSTQYKPQPGQYPMPPSYLPQLPATYQYPIANQYQIPLFPSSSYLPSSSYQISPYAYPTSTSTCSTGFTTCFSGSFCCRK